jgi:hypothetical protein
MADQGAGTQSQQSSQSGPGGDESRLGVPKVMQLLGGAELIPNPLLVERHGLDLRRLPKWCGRNPSHHAHVSECFKMCLSIPRTLRNTQAPLW